MERFITMWEFRSIDGKQVVIAEREYHPDDLKYQHEYQKIIYRGPVSGYVKQKQ